MYFVTEGSSLSLPDSLTHITVFLEAPLQAGARGGDGEEPLLSESSMTLRQRARLLA